MGCVPLRVWTSHPRNDKNLADPCYLGCTSAVEVVSFSGMVSVRFSGVSDTVVSQKSNLRFHPEVGVIPYD